MDFASRMAEEKIQQAIRDGELDHLEGKGKPLQLEDLSGMPEDMRMSYHMMKNAGYLPEEVKLNKELISLKDMIAACKDEEEKQKYQKKLTEKELQYRLLMDKRNLSKSPAFKKYSGKINRLFGI
ncbi:DUF1992 domain-containing protein [Aquibacillus sediminis]|uniref:DnaJ family domain-containing protein n=1 Tax=Aquibacillus sediminis TaxID=2574734 RepID=UPI00110905EA|nr:DUF1992 domain-containing protein [Aquibacillus sediminis]